MPTNRERFLKYFDLPKDTSLSLEQVSRLTGIPLAALQEVYNRGIGAWKTNPSSVRLQRDFRKDPDLRRFPRSARLTKEQWAMARVYAFIMGTQKVFYGADRDIAVNYNLM